MHTLIIMLLQYIYKFEIDSEDYVWYFPIYPSRNVSPNYLYKYIEQYVQSQTLLVLTLYNSTEIYLQVTHTDL